MILHKATFGERSTVLLKYSVFNRLEVPWKLIWSKLGDSKPENDKPENDKPENDKPENDKPENDVSVYLALIKKLEILWKLIRNKLEIKQEDDDSKEDDKPKNDGSVYLALVKNYESLEWFDDADACYDQYMCRKSKSLSWPKKFIDIIYPFYLYGYGVHPLYPIFAMGMLTVIFAGIYLLYGLTFSYVEAGEISIKMLVGMPMGNSTDLTGFCGFWSIVERILGWMLMSSFLVVLAKKHLR